MWPITVQNIGEWIAVLSVLGTQIASWIHTQAAVKQHSKELGLGEDKSLRERVLLLEQANEDLEERVRDNHKAAVDRHDQIIHQLGELGGKLDKIAEAVYRAAGTGTNNEES